MENKIILDWYYINKVHENNYMISKKNEFLSTNRPAHVSAL